MGEFLLRLAVALPVVVGTAVAVLWVARHARWRWPPGPVFPFVEPFGRGSANAIEVVAARVVHPGVRVVALRYGGRELLLGVTPQGLTLLHNNAAPLDVRPAMPEPQP
ncbi:MAG: flagellar biosynthetic protein FliO [Thermaurantiacus sp.]|nr:flagellar biosynthetic protein FliO [Thermaurantiacus sp.]